MSFKIGCDPEIFVGNSSGFKSIIGTIGGTKDFPRPIPELGDGFAVQEDNVALEFNIPASADKPEFINNVVKCRDFLSTVMSDAFNMHLRQESAAIFDDSELEHPMARQFGCDPDYNAWTMERNPRPKAANPNLRSCGGHVHIGHDLGKDAGLEIIRGMDLLCGVPSVLMDKGDMRKQLYGKSGAYRFKDYGVEYRVLSNFWIFDERLMAWVYDNTAKVLDAVKQGQQFLQYKDIITKCIDNNDKDMAKELVNQFNLEVV